MKKFICLFLTLVLVLGLCACGTAGSTETTEAKAEPQFMVGYGRQDITPEEPVALMGYGRTDKRISTAYLDPLYFSCVAMRDTEGGTILMMSVDNITGGFTKTIKDNISKATGVPAQNITITATHTHSGPDMDNTTLSYTSTYNAMYKERAVKAATDAIADLKPAKMYFAEIETEGLNFVRHYKMVDGSYAGDNFGDFSIGIEDYASETDTTMYLLKFTREGGEDVIMMNWRAHASMTGGSTKTQISADFVGSVRMYLEEKLGCKFAYYQGCAGNINPRSRIEADTPTDNYKEYGQKLGDFALLALNDATELPTGPVRAIEVTLTTKVNHDLDHLKDVAKAIYDKYNVNGDWSAVKAEAASYGIRSSYMASAIVSHADMDPTFDENLTCLAIGDSLAFATAPNELFDTNGVYVEENSPFEKTIVLGYTNGQRGYVPSQQAYDYTCYESDTTRFAPGTGEQIADKLLNMLNQLK